MEEPSATLEIAKLVASGALGALSALLGQWLSNRSAARRYEAEVKQRERELWAQLAVAPLGPRRMEACEEIYDRVQGAIETKRLDMNDYLALRPKLLYVPGLRPRLLSALLLLAEATRSDSKQQQEAAVEDLRQAQEALESELGLPIMESGVRSLTTRRTRK